MKLVTLKTAIDHKPRAEDFAVIDVTAPECPIDGVLVRVTYLSLDPYQGSRLRGRHMGEAPPAPMKGAVPGGVVGQVIESRTDKINIGDWIHSMDGSWAETVALRANQCRKLDPAIAPMRAHIGVLGMPGLTAWVGTTQLAEVGDGDVFLVDAAAGPVGGTAGQIARIKGAKKVVGVAGGPEKCAIVTDVYGFDVCVDYKKGGWRDDLASALPDGLSVFFENVSADMAMIALSHANLYARGVLCGLVDAYHAETQSQHPLNAGFIIGKRAKLMGLVVYDFYARWNEYVAEAAPWIASEKLKFVEDAVDGLENAPALFERLMDGKNVGKCVVTVSNET
jgi:NADPH-dependent curcumin reductase CurA